MPKRKAQADKPSEADANPRKPKSAKRGGCKEAYTSSQKAAISEFVGVSQADKSTAAKILKHHGWNVTTAVNAFFSNPSNTTASPIRGTLSSTFDKYRDDPQDAPDEINVEGTSRLLGELDIDLSDVGALVFSELVSSPSLGVITRDGFVDGWASVGEDSLPRMRNVVLQRRSQLSTDRGILKNVYNHTFVLALQEKQKALPVEIASEFWRVLFTAPALEWRSSTTPWLEWWLEFYESKIKKAVNKDLWKQTLNFALATLDDDSLGFWSEDSSWPSVIDEFVEWVKTEKRSGSGEAMEVE